MLSANPVVSRVLGTILSERVEGSFARKLAPPEPGLPKRLALPPSLQIVEWLANPIGYLEACRERCGDTFSVHFPGEPLFVMFSNPEHIKEIFTGDIEDLRAGEANVILEPVLGKHSLILLDGQAHLRERRLMMPAFHGERMQAYVRVMREITKSVARRFPMNTPFSVHAQMQAITLDVIVHTIFGVDELGAATRLRETLATLLDIGTNPMLLMKFIQRDLGPRSPWGRVVVLKRRVDAELYALIAAARVREREGRDDILSMLIDARDESGRALSDRELHDEMITLLIAGHETTATTLSWMFYWLTTHPEVQEELRAEVASVTHGEELEAKHIGELKLLDATVKETLRLRPVVPVVGRMLSRPMRIGGYDLPKGCVAIPNIYLTHRNPNYWPNPDSFEPKRFVDARINPYAYLPFGGGVRRCIGMAFATTEAKVVMATLLSHARFKAVPGETTRVARRGITFVPSGGMPVIAEALRS